MSICSKLKSQRVNQTSLIPSEPIWRFTVEQYHQMIHLGILDEDDPVELLAGWIVPKMPKNPPHRAATKLTRNILEVITPNGWYVDTQEPITLEDSEPEPDLVIVRGDTRDYLDRHPGVQDLALVVEISEATLERDRTSKKYLYARAGIPVYWILNLREEKLEVYTEPVTVGETITYQKRQDYGPLDKVYVIIEGSIVGRLTVQGLLPSL